MTTRYLCCIFMVLLASCAPGLGTDVEVTALPSQSRKIRSVFSGARIQVKRFSDERRDRESIQMNDRKVLVTGDLGTIVQGGFEEAVKESGGTLCLFDCASIEGEILAWSLDTRPDFPTTKVSSAAELTVRLISPEGKVLFTGRYFGKMSGERPYYTEAQLLEAFGTSMNEAIASAVNDPSLRPR